MLNAVEAGSSMTVREEDLPYFGVMMTQLSLKQGLQVFGKKGEESALKEMKQLHDMHTFFSKRREISNQNRTIQSIVIPYIPERKEQWRNKRTHMCQWGAAESLHQKGRCSISDSHDRLSVHYWRN